MALVENVKKGGPYTRKEQGERREEVYRLHFGYGYSASKIAELMKINRNTINNDINYWYSEIGENSIIDDAESIIVIATERLDLQRTRLREYLDKTFDIQEKLTIERLIYEIDSRLTTIHQKIAESEKRLINFGTNYLNEYLESKNDPNRYLAIGGKISLSKEAKEKIDEIIKEDRENHWKQRVN